jgi:P27 family predicted phage terminase small subunit
MGRRGPQPLPANVHRLRGNASKKPNAALDGELRPEVDMPSAPSWLWPEARAEWRRLKPELLSNGLVARQDRAALVLHCQAWAEYVHHKQAMHREMQAAAEKKAAAEAAGQEWTGGDGIMVRTANGNFTYSHHWVCANKAYQQVKDGLALFGLSPSTRGGVKASDNRQAALFEDATPDEWNDL